MAPGLRKAHVIPWIKTIYKDCNFLIQWDGAPAHRATDIQAMLTDKLGRPDRFCWRDVVASVTRLELVWLQHLERFAGESPGDFSTQPGVSHGLRSWSSAFLSCFSKFSISLLFISFAMRRFFFPAAFLLSMVLIFNRFEAFFFLSFSLYTFVKYRDLTRWSDSRLLSIFFLFLSFNSISSYFSGLVFNLAL